MLPPMITGWPHSRYAVGRPGMPAASARVAPLRCTRSSRSRPGGPWRSSFAVLWVTS